MEWNENSLFEDQSSVVFAEREKFLKSEKPPTIKINDYVQDGRVINIETDSMIVRYGNLGQQDQSLFYINSPSFSSDTLEIQILSNKSIRCFIISLFGG